MMRHNQHLTCLAFAVLFALFATTHLMAQDDWPTFRGADRTGVAPDTDLLEQWPAEGPKLVWEANGAGRGYADVSISDGRLYTLGDGPSTANDEDEYLTCFDAANGQQLWRAKTGAAFTLGQKNWESSRSTPTIDGDRVYVITPLGKLVCVNTEGTEQWQVDLKEKFGGKKAEMWGYSESVLIDGNNLICTPGGPDNTMVALNKMTGDKVWSTARDGDRGAGHASAVVSQVGSTRVLVQTTGSGAMGVRANDGKLLWTYDIEKTTAVAPTPIIRDDLVFISAGYGRGGALLRQSVDGENVKVTEVYPLNPKLANKHGGIVLVGDYLYGDTDDRGTPFCAEFMTGDLMWKSRGSGKQSASITAADGHLYIRYSDGTMTLAKADPESFQEVSNFKVPGSGDRPSWAHPVILSGRLYLREGDKILCYDISENGVVGQNAQAEAASRMKPASTTDESEMLINGTFTDGKTNWEIDGGDGKNVESEIVKEGPNGESAMRFKVISVPDEPWQIQMYQSGLSFEKDQSYVLTYWVKSNQVGAFKVNCMQNHEPWEHSTEQDMYPSTEWKQQEFEFRGPWDDKNARITFTDLGTDEGRIYWFTNVSLKAKVNQD